MEFQTRHAAPKALSAASRTSAMVFQALRHLGRTAVDEQVIARLQSAEELVANWHRMTPSVRTATLDLPRRC
jgi:hypothetical protein